MVTTPNPETAPRPLLFDVVSMIMLKHGQEPDAEPEDDALIEMAQIALALLLKVADGDVEKAVQVVRSLAELPAVMVKVPPRQ